MTPGPVFIVVVCRADGAELPISGAFLESFDFDTPDGLGFGLFTRDPVKAKEFASVGEAAAFWRTVSKTRPVRDDGKPNRPFTATTITFVNAQEARTEALDR